MLHYLFTLSNLHKIFLFVALEHEQFILNISLASLFLKLLPKPSLYGQKFISCHMVDIMRFDFNMSSKGITIYCTWSFGYQKPQWIVERLQSFIPLWSLVESLSWKHESSSIFLSLLWVLNFVPKALNTMFGCQLIHQSFCLSMDLLATTIISCLSICWSIF